MVRKGSEDFLFFVSKKIQRKIPHQKRREVTKTREIVATIVFMISTERTLIFVKQNKSKLTKYHTFFCFSNFLEFHSGILLP